MIKKYKRIKKEKNNAIDIVQIILLDQIRLLPTIQCLRLGPSILWIPEQVDLTTRKLAFSDRFRDKK